jgi:hypothetical protein
MRIKATVLFSFFFISDSLNMNMGRTRNVQSLVMSEADIAITKECSYRQRSYCCVGIRHAQSECVRGTFVGEASLEECYSAAVNPTLEYDEEEHENTK